jgi:hypothetical protein
MDPSKLIEGVSSTSPEILPSTLTPLLDVPLSLLPSERSSPIVTLVEKPIPDRASSVTPGAVATKRPARPFLTAGLPGGARGLSDVWVVRELKASYNVDDEV